MKDFHELMEQERNELAYEALKILARRYTGREDIWFGPSDVGNQIGEQYKINPVWPSYVRKSLDFLFEAGKISAILVYRTKRGEKGREDTFLRFYRPLLADLSI